MKKVMSFLCDNKIAFHFANVKPMPAPAKSNFGIGISYIDADKREELLQIASDEELIIEVANGYIITDPNDTKEAAPVAKIRTSAAPARAKIRTSAAPKKAAKKK